MTIKKEESATQAVAKTENSVEFLPLGANTKLRLTASMVRQFIAVPTKSGALPSERDCIRFIMLCKGKRLNPFEGDCFLIGYDTANGPSFSIVAGVEAFQKRAEQNPNFDGIESGVIVRTGTGPLEERQGSLVLAGETILGGWCKVYRKDHSHPLYKSVKFETYDTKKSRWEKDPGGMIEKVARSQGEREAFPTPLGGLYTQEEMEKVTQTGEGLIGTGGPEPIAMPKAIETTATEVVTPPTAEASAGQQQTVPPSSPETPREGPSEGRSEVRGIVEKITAKSGKKKDGSEYTAYGIYLGSQRYGTFDSGLAAAAKALEKREVVITWQPEGEYRTLIDIQAVPPEKHDEPDLEATGKQLFG